MSDFYSAYISAVLEAIYIKFYRDIRVVYTRENMPRLTLAAACIRREHQTLFVFVCLWC